MDRREPERGQWYEINPLAVVTIVCLVFWVTVLTCALSGR